MHWIDKLDMKPHPEGGYYKELYRAEHTFESNGKQRAVCTSIYYLLNDEAFSAFHRLDADEIWHLYDGPGLMIHCLSPQGKWMSQPLNQEGNFQVIVPAGWWFAAELIEPKSHALVGCTVAPGFEFSHFEMASKDHLLSLGVGNNALIERLCLS